MRVLAVDENPRIRDLVREYLHTAGYQVVVADNYSEAEDFLSSNSVAVVVAEIQETEAEQREFSRFLKEHPDVHVIVHTAWPRYTETPLGSVEEARMEKHSDFRTLLRTIDSVLGCPTGSARSA